MRTRLVLGALVVGALGSCCRPPPPQTCGLSPQERLAAPPDSPVWATLRQAHIDNAAENANLNATQRLYDCRAHWGTVVNERSCSRASQLFCAQQCLNAEDRQRCTSGQGHFAVMEQCRRQSIDTFVSIYTSCQGFHLCQNDVLLPPSVTCPG